MRDNSDFHGSRIVDNRRECRHGTLDRQSTQTIAYVSADFYTEVRYATGKDVRSLGETVETGHTERV